MELNMLDNGSLGYLYSLLADCENKCKICGKPYEHLFDNSSPFFDQNGPIPNCQNGNQKAAIKRVIEKRKLRMINYV